MSTLSSDMSGLSKLVIRCACVRLYLSPLRTWVPLEARQNKINDFLGMAPTCSRPQGRETLFGTTVLVHKDVHEPLVRWKFPGGGFLLIGLTIGSKLSPSPRSG